MEKICQFFKLLAKKAKSENTWTLSMKYKFDDRIKFMLDMVKEVPYKSVMDLGCGNQDAKKYLSPAVEYIPVNYMNQTPNTIIRDFNKGQFCEREADLMLGSGILEYIYDPLPFLLNVSKHCRCYFCLSYVLGEYRKEKAEKWVNSLTRDELLALLDLAGFTLIREEWYQPNHQKVFLLSKKSL